MADQEQEELSLSKRENKDLKQEDVQKVMSQLKISGYNRGVVRNVSNAAEKIGRQQISEAVEKTEKGDDS